MSDGRRQHLLQVLERAGQRHLFDALESLDASMQPDFVRQLESLDWDEMRSLAALIAAPKSGGSPDLAPAPGLQKGKDPAKDAAARERGEALLRSGRAAAFVVAGGQGSRLGFEGPKGLYPATPIRRRSLFEVFAAKLAALGRRYGHPIPWYLMTSDTNHDATRRWFEEKGYLGLDPQNVRFLQQDMLPAMDARGRVLCSAPGSLFLSPNGHGGSLLALLRSGALDDMKRRGIEQIFYFQVDNPLVEICDPIFLGLHDLEGAEMSSKVVEKRDAAEKVGVVGLIGGRYGVIEYSDLSDSERNARDAAGVLRFKDGNIAVHAIRRDFVESLTAGGRLELPYHLARKAIPCIDPESGLPGRVDGVKFETFVFDALSFCRRSVVLRVDRSREFAPIKNASGEDSPETSSLAQSRLFADWLEAAGVPVPRDAAGQPLVPIEIDPLFADNAEALRQRLAGSSAEIRVSEAPLVLE